MIQIDFIYAVNQEIHIVFYSPLPLKMKDKLDFLGKEFVITKIELLDDWTKYTATRIVSDTTIITRALLFKLKDAINNKELKLIN